MPIDVHAIEPDVHHAYRLILGREPDPDGLRHYVGRVRDGLPLTDLIGSLLDSAEYRERATTRALEQPATTPTATAPSTETQDAAPSPRIVPSDLIQRYTVEQLIETAEEYYRRVPDTTPLMSKPWSFLHETPEMLENLGRLLDGLAPGEDLVLDLTLTNTGEGEMAAREHRDLWCRARGHASLRRQRHPPRPRPFQTHTACPGRAG
ncbi:MAG: hypothetical protein ABS36_09645 [Acidobacteria bacterium SCN 69-37]|nr:MAG: hypothetical protein ABS36_09645 [Acidobacteria bacterium SCN 69-37]